MNTRLICKNGKCDENIRKKSLKLTVSSTKINTSTCMIPPDFLTGLEKLNKLVSNPEVLEQGIQVFI